MSDKSIEKIIIKTHINYQHENFNDFNYWN
jgi:hypothetical protein